MTFARGPAAAVAPALAAERGWARGIGTGPMTSIDPHGPGRSFATSKLAQGQASLFAGRFVDFGELRLSGLRELEGWGPPPQAPAS